MVRPRCLLGLVVGAAVLAWAPPLVSGQTPDVREAIRALVYDPLEWSPPAPERHEVSGVTTLLLEDRALPLVTIIANFRGGYGLFGRDQYAATMGLPALLRYGGTATTSPDSVELLLEFYAMQTSFQSAGVSMGSTLNTLTGQLDESLDLWWDLIADPGFDEDQIEIWRGRQLERVLRRADDPGGLAYSAFNRLLYGDHSIGWELDAGDLALDRTTPEQFRQVHARIFCRENLTLGVAGDIAWDEARPRLERLVGALPSCPEALLASAIPEIRRGGGIFLIERDLEQAVIIMAHPTSVRLADEPQFFAATMGNAILGGGGFSSRILQRVRTDEGYAYSASSLWTTPRRYDGLIGATTRTSPENAVPAIDVILGTMDEMRGSMPTDSELKTAVDRIVNGYVFNFQAPEQIVQRLMAYVSGELPEDWLERYAEGVQEVTADDIQRVFADHLRPEEMTILVVGDPDRIGWDALAQLGPVTVLEPQSPN